MAKQKNFNDRKRSNSKLKQTLTIIGAIGVIVTILSEVVGISTYCSSIFSSEKFSIKYSENEKTKIIFFAQNNTSSDVIIKETPNLLNGNNIIKLKFPEGITKYTIEKGKSKDIEFSTLPQDLVENKGNFKCEFIIKKNGKKDTLNVSFTIKKL